MVQITRVFVLLSAATLGLGLLVNRDAASIQTELSAISTQLDTFDRAIMAYAGGPRPTLDINNQASAIAVKVNTVAGDITNSPSFSEADGRKILDLINGLVQPIYNVMVHIVGKKPVFARLLIGSIALRTICQDLQKLRDGTTNLARGLSAKLTSNLAPEVAPLEAKITSYFVYAVNAFCY